MSLEAKVITGAKWSAIGAWSRKLVSFVVFIILARLIEPESMGLVALAGVYIAFAEMIVRQGVGMAVIQRQELTDSFLDNAYLLNTVTALVMAILSFFFAGTIAKFLGDSRLETIIMVLAINFPINAMVIVPVALQTRDFLNKQIAMQTFLSSLFSAAIAIPMAYLGFEVWALVAQSIAASCSYWVIVRYCFKWNYSALFNKTEFVELTGFCFRMTLSNFTLFARNRTDQLLVGWLAGPSGIGFYSVALRLLTTIESFTNGPVDKVATPAFSRVQHEREKLEYALVKSCRLNAMIVIPIFMGIAVTSGEIIPIVFGQNWNAAIPIAKLLALMFLSKTLFFFIWPLLVSVNRPATIIWFQATHAIAIFPSVYIGSQWGLEGIACGVFVSVTVVSILWAWIVCHLLNLTFIKLMGSLISPLIAGIIMFTGVFLLKDSLIELQLNEFLLLLISALSGAVIYISIYRLFFFNMYSEMISLVKKTLNLS